MSRKRIRGKVLRMMELIAKSSGYVIPLDKIKFSHSDSRTDERVFKIFMPITKTWEEIRIKQSHVAEGVLPMHVLKLVEHHLAMTPLMQRARDVKAFDEDVRPISAEEKQVFGVRTGRNHPLFPNTFDRRYSDEIVDAIEYLQRSVSESFYGIDRGVSVKDRGKYGL